MLLPVLVHQGEIRRGNTGRPLAAGLSSGPAGTLPSGVGSGVPLV